MAESACTALGLIQCFNFYPFRLLMTCYYHLGDALAVVYYEFLLRQVYQNHPYFAAVIGIYCSGSVKYRNTLVHLANPKR